MMPPLDRPTRPVAAGCNPREVRMADYLIISADSHIVEPPDMYTARFDPKLRNRRGLGRPGSARGRGGRAGRGGDGPAARPAARPPRAEPPRPPAAPRPRRPPPSASAAAR